MPADKCYAVSLGNRPSNSTVVSEELKESSKNSSNKSRKTKSKGSYTSHKEILEYLPKHQHVASGKYDKLAFFLMIIMIIVFIGLAINEFWQR